MSHGVVVPMLPRAERIARAVKRIQDRWDIRYVAATGEFFVIDKTRQVCNGQAIVCRDEEAVKALIERALRG